MNDDLLEKLKTIKTDIKNKNFSPFYFLYGDEQYFISSIVKDIRKEFDDSSGLNTKIYGEDGFDVKNAIENINNMPFMNAKKLIIFRNVDIFRFKKQMVKDAKEMIEAIEKAKDVNIIVVAMDEYGYKYKEHYTKSNLFVDFASKNGTLVYSKKLTGEELAKYAQKFFKKDGFEIDPVNLAYFVKNAGKDIETLKNETNKIKDYLGTAQKVTKDIIDKCVCRNIDDSVFTLIDYVNNHRQNEAYKLYADILSEGTSEFTLLSFFTSNFQDLLLVKDLTEQSKTLKDICSITKLADWKVRKMQNANRGMSKETLLSKLKKITKLNTEYMKGNISDNLMIELLLA